MRGGGADAGHDADRRGSSGARLNFGLSAVAAVAQLPQCGGREQSDGYLVADFIAQVFFPPVFKQLRILRDVYPGYGGHIIGKCGLRLCGN